MGSIVRTPYETIKEINSPEIDGEMKMGKVFTVPAKAVQTVHSASTYSIAQRCIHSQVWCLI